jgi:hypothetical protein
VDFLEAHPDPAEVVTTEAIASAIDGGRTNGAPPTRLRNIVGSAIGSLSRLRRGPVADDPAHAANPPVEARDTRDLRAGPRVGPETLITRSRAATDLPDSPAKPTSQVDITGSTRNPDDAVHAVEKGSSHRPMETPLGGRADQPPPGPPPSPSLVQTSRRSAEASANAEGLQSPVVQQIPHPVENVPVAEPDLLAVARVCSDLGRVADTQELQRLLQEVAGIFEAPGLVVWVWDPAVDGLRPAMVHGYSDRVVAQLPTVSRDADNATAAAFRDGEARATKGTAHASGALVVPLLTFEGCAGVLAIELPQGRAQSRALTAIATIFAAMLAQLIGRSRAELDDAVDDESLTEGQPNLPLQSESSTR